MTGSAKGTMDAPGTYVRQKAGLNRAILDQGWHGFETVLAYKLEERGGHLCKVDPRHTSQTCSACGAVDREGRESQASFHCLTCGFRAHADHNAAINILRRNTASMIVEEGHRLSVEAITAQAVTIPLGNLPASAEGRC
jgi:putative transposase